RKRQREPPASQALTWKNTHHLQRPILPRPQPSGRAHGIEPWNRRLKVCADLSRRGWLVFLLAFDPSPAIAKNAKDSAHPAIQSNFVFLTLGLIIATAFILAGSHPPLLARQ